MKNWKTATVEERLKQIDAGIELGMTSKQVAMCLRAPIYANRANAVLMFANSHGRYFPHQPTNRRAVVRGTIDRNRKVAGVGFRETKNGEFEIFPRRPEPALFDEVSYD